MDIFDAIRNSCDTDAARRILAADPGQVAARTADHDQPLHLAVWERCHDIVRLLIQSGADLNAPGNNGWTPMHYAASYGGIDMIDILHEAGAALDAKDDSGSTPLLAARYEPEQRRLIEHGAAIDVTTAVDLRLTKSHPEVLKRSPQAWHAPEARNALLTAVRQQDAQIVRLLLDNGADPNVASGTFPLLMALSCNRNNLEIIRMLIAAGANVNADLGFGAAGVPSTPLALARAVGFDEAVELLEAAGAAK